MCIFYIPSFLTKILYAILISASIRCNMSVQLIILDFAILTIFCDKDALYGSSLFNSFFFFHILMEIMHNKRPQMFIIINTLLLLAVDTTGYMRPHYDCYMMRNFS